MAMRDDSPPPARPRIDPEPLLRPTPPNMTPPPRGGLAVAAEQTPVAEFQGQPARLLVAVDLPRPLRAQPVRRADRQRQADPGAVPGRLLHADLELLPRDRVRRGFPDRGRLSRHRGAVPDRLGRAGGLLGRSRRRHRRGGGNGAFAGEEVAQGWLIWPLIPYSYNTVNDLGRSAPSPPDADHWLGTDDTARDVLARVIYGFRLSVSFALVVTFLTSVIGIAAGAARAISAACST
jgi:hypothetical protein